MPASAAPAIKLTKIFHLEKNLRALETAAFFMNAPSQFHPAP